ncbi:peptidyl-prolyl cis-trans isomerase [Marinobacter changyiensis]|uniref:peptidylprolyl isomerase n=1 Tax=Marinobacter changyiensis TaxID=2604091 RepID=UPI0012652C08|nr:peptidylprolyl isomerase [Marinobacter changyiensis]
MIIRRVVRSPLAHFFVLGGLIFVLFAAISDEPPPSLQEDIVLTPGEAQRLADQFADTWRRTPTAEELESLMQSWAQEEVFAREAIALGLDRGDAIIQSRLSQKMQFVAESAAGSIEPTDEALAAYLKNNRDRFARSPAFAIEQVLLPANANREVIDGFLAELENGSVASAVGEATLLPTALPKTPAPAIDAIFGRGFHDALEPLTLGQWSGPVASSRGRHLVRVTDREDAQLPPLADIRDRVEAKWRASRAREMRESYGKALLDRYDITLPSAADVLSQ